MEPVAIDIFDELVRLRREGAPCVLCTVVRTAGSTPRKNAARMLVMEGGALIGTIGGGRIEKEVVDSALALLAEGSAAHSSRLRAIR